MSLLLLTLEVPGSNLGQDTSYIERRFLVIFLSHNMPT